MYLLHPVIGLNQCVTQSSYSVSQSINEAHNPLQRIQSINRWPRLIVMCKISQSINQSMPNILIILSFFQFYVRKRLHYFSAGKSKSKPAFRLKKKKSFKEKADDHHHSSKTGDELMERTKIKHKANTNPFDDRPAAAEDSKRKPGLSRALSRGSWFICVGTIFIWSIVWLIDRFIRLC